VGSFFKTVEGLPSNSTKLILNTLPVRYDATYKILFDLKSILKQPHRDLE